MPPEKKPGEGPRFAAGAERPGERRAGSPRASLRPVRAWMPGKLRGMDAPAAVVTGWRGVSGLGSSDGWNQGGGGAP